MDKVDLEDATITLLAGVDLNEENELLFYLSSPVFSKEAKAKSEEFGVKAKSFREARFRMDELVTGLTLSGKIQVIILGKRLLQHPEWFRILDVMFRDARSTVNARVVAYDGEIKDLFHFKPKDKPRLALHLTKLIDTANHRNLTAKTRVQELHRQMTDLGITPIITELKKKDSVVQVMGTALLNKKGKYAKLIQPPESILLQMLLYEKRGEIALSIPLSEEREEDKVVEGWISFYVKEVSNKITPSYQNGRFRFEVRQKLKIAISERLFPYNMDKDYKKMEQEIAKELTKRYEKLVKKCQMANTDPFGFGIYARAYQFQEWKKVKDNWPKAFAKSTVHIVPEVSIKGNGLVK
jgi:Ger(x)C family germination protein